VKEKEKEEKEKEMSLEDNNNNDNNNKEKERKIKRRIAFLHKKIEDLRVAYYQKEEPLTSDEKYDRLFAELKLLEEKHPNLQNSESPTQRAGPKQAKQERRSLSHAHPMLGLENIYNHQEIVKFVEKLTKHHLDIHHLDQSSDQSSDHDHPLRIVTELKYDGMALSLRYSGVDGTLLSAITRGSGTEGEDVMDQVKTLISNIPLSVTLSDVLKRIGGDIHIRGEIVAKRSVLEAINNGLFSDISPDGKKFSGCRNLVTGLINRRQPLNPSESYKLLPSHKVLDFVGFDLLFEQENEIDEELNRHWNRILILDQMGFQTDSFRQLHQDSDSVIRFVDDWNNEEARKGRTEYETDGIVIKADDKRLQRKMGSNARSPKSMVAFKFWQQKAITTLLDIQWQVGRTGKCTPVACLDPVNLSHSIVSRASLYNFDFITRHSISPGASVLVERSGGVIPKVVGVVSSLSDAPVSPLSPLCPCERKTKLSPRILSGPKNKQSIDLFCEDASCPEKQRQQYVHFMKTIGIQGAAEGLVCQLLSSGLIGKDKDFHLVDVFSLPLCKDLLQNLDGWGHKKTESFCQQIECCKSILTFDSLLEAVGIPSIASSLCLSISSSFHSFSQLSLASEDQLLSSGLSKNAVSSLLSFFSSDPSPLPWLLRLDSILKTK